MSEIITTLIVGVVLAVLVGQYDFGKAKIFLKELRDYPSKNFLKNWKAPKARGRAVTDIRSLFSGMPENKLDCVIYQMGIRPRIPLMDCIYHLYLKSLLREGKIVKVVIIATQDLSSPEQNEQELFSKNTSAIYGEYAKHIHISFLSEDATLASQLLTDNFNAAVKHIEDTEFIRWWKNKLDIKDAVTKKAIINLLHPIPGNLSKIIDDESPLGWTARIRNQSGLYNIVHHINRTWIICCSLDRIIPELGSRPKDQLAIGSIFWEIEIAKLGMLDAFIKQKSGFTHYPILGATVAHRDGKSAIPTHKHSEAICIYDDVKNLVSKMESKSKLDRESHVSLLGLIAKEFSVEEDAKKLTTLGRSLFEKMEHNGECPSGMDVSTLKNETYQAAMLIDRISFKTKEVRV